MDYEFDPEKNAWRLAHHGIGFEQIIPLIEVGKLLQVLEHPNQTKYPGAVAL